MTAYRLTKIKRWSSVRKRLWNVITIPLATLIISLVVCEWLIFEVAISFCAFPVLYNQSTVIERTPDESSKLWKLRSRTIGKRASGVLNVMLLGDLHLFGNIRGHWADRLKRETQMRTAFRTAVRQMDPDVIFLLGDALDEGKWADTVQFEKITRRFNRYFRDYARSKGVEMYMVTGNHDIGFHYDMNYIKILRFEENFNSTLVKLVVKNGVPFVLLNSVTMKNDSCHICQETMRRLRETKRILNCLYKPGDYVCEQILAKNDIHLGVNEKVVPNPIMLQHYPLFRQNESDCIEADWGSMNLHVETKLKEDWDVLSKNVSRNLVSILKPRLAISGHSHYYCKYLHNFTSQKTTLEEVTINSFSWKNNDNAHFLLLSVNNDQYDFKVCSLPRETFQIFLYCVFWCYSFVCIKRRLKNPNVSLFLDFDKLSLNVKRVVRSSTLLFNLHGRVKQL